METHPSAPARTKAKRPLEIRLSPPPTPEQMQKEQEAWAQLAANRGANRRWQRIGLRSLK